MLIFTFFQSVSANRTVSTSTLATILESTTHTDGALELINGEIWENQAFYELQFHDIESLETHDIVQSKWVSHPGGQLDYQINASLAVEYSQLDIGAIKVSKDRYYFNFSVLFYTRIQKRRQSKANCQKRKNTS